MLLRTPEVTKLNTRPQLPVIQVTALYEDLEAGVRAKALLDCMQSDEGLPARFKAELWRFDWLGEISLGNMALSAARSSMLVIVAASSGNPVPLEMQRWLRVWGQSREEQLSAVVLLAAGAAFPHPMQHCLQRVARQKGVEFHCEFYDPAQGSQRLVNYRALREEPVPAVPVPRLSGPSNRNWAASASWRQTNPSRYEELARFPAAGSSAR